MIILKIIVFIILWRIYPEIISSIMKLIRFFCSKIKYIFRRIYRALNIKKAPHYVWKELIKYHKTSGWNFGQFDKYKRIECDFKVDDINCADFNYAVANDKLTFRATILQNFDEERTNDILVLASHFNGLLSFGTVKVSVKYNYVEFFYSRDLSTYSLFPEEINSDTEIHFNLAKDCYWSFTNLIETGEDPVFVFSELLKRKEEGNNNTI